jgi:ABC-type cobalamin transport system permease subunit
MTTASTPIWMWPVRSRTEQDAFVPRGYLTVQQIYRGWALLGIAVLGALLSTLILAVFVRDNRRLFYLVLASTLCIAISLLIFFLFTFPANQQTENWTRLPEHWQELRQQWESSHAVSAGLYFVALTALTFATLVERE